MSETRPRVGWRRVLTVLAALAAALLTSAGADAAAEPSGSQLLQTYQPAFVFHPQELLRPTKVQSFVDHSELQQFTGTTAQRAAVDKPSEDSTHPIAYVALGSHANYFAPGTLSGGGIPINPLCLPPGVPAEIALDRVVDGSSVGAVVGPLGSGVEAATIHRIEGTAWSEFGGFWGETEYFFTPVAIGPFPANSVIPAGPAPSSPANQSKWNPAVVLGWPSA